MRNAISIPVFLCALVAGLVSSPQRAEAHLVYGRRPFDFFIGKADAVVVVAVKTPTRRETGADGGPIDITGVMVQSCLDGACPKGIILTAGSDDHAPSLEHDGRYVLALQATPVKLASGRSAPWRILQNSWETHPLTATYLDGVKTLTPQYRRALTLRGVERERLYLETLIAQAGHVDPLLQADAIQSLLRFPPDRATPRDVAALHEYLKRETLSESSRLGLLIVSSTWEPVATRQFLRTTNWALFENENLARALNYLGYGNLQEAAVPCRWLTDGNPAVRAAAVSACIPAGRDWTLIVVESLDDASPQVQKAAKNRLRKNVKSKDAVRAWSLRNEPWWRRAYFVVTGREPAAVKEIFTDSGVAKP